MTRLTHCYNIHTATTVLKLKSLSDSVCVCVRAQNEPEQIPSGPSFVVVVAIDFGTTSSGYAYAFTKEPECIHVMR